MPRARTLHGRAAAARLLVQRPLRRLPRLPRHRQPRGGGRVAGGARPVAVAERGRHRAVQDRQLLPAGAARRGRAPRHRRRHPVGGYAQEGAGRASARPGQGQGARRLRHGGRSRDVLVHRVGGRAGRSAAPLPGGSVRRSAREAGQLLRHRSVPDLRRQAPEARDPRRHGERTLHPRHHRDERGGLARILRRPRVPRVGGAYRRAHREGDQGAPQVPRGRGSGLPHAGARHGDALRRRGAAHPPGHADRRGPHGRALHPGRAFHRPAPARQRAAHRHARAPARLREHRHRGGARRGHHPQRRLRGGHGPGRGRARRRDRGHRHAGRDHEGRRLAHGRLPVGPAPHRGAREAPQAAPRVAQADGRHREQPAQRHARGSLRHAHRGHGRVRLGQELAGHRHAGAGAREPREPCAPPHGRLQEDHRAGQDRQGHQHRPEPHRAHAAF